MIEPIEVPLNSMFIKTGRLAELFDLMETLDYEAGDGTWGAWFKTNRYRRLIFLEDKVLQHIRWYIKRKYPKMPKMGVYRYKNGWLLLPWGSV